MMWKYTAASAGRAIVALQTFAQVIFLLLFHSLSFSFILITGNMNKMCFFKRGVFFKGLCCE